MQIPPTVGSRPAGPGLGGLLGLAAGGVVFAAWVNDLLLGVAVLGVIGGLIATVIVAGPGWQRFGFGLLAGAVVSAAACVGVLWAMGSLGSLGS